MARTSHSSIACRQALHVFAFLVCSCCLTAVTTLGACQTEPDRPASASSRPARPGMELIVADPDPGSFSKGALPRTAAIADDATLNDICCVGALCWAVGERGVIARSTDSGQSWTTSMLPFECSLQSVCFLTNKLGWTAGTRFHPRINGRSQGVLLQTRDGGHTWNQVSDDSMPTAGSGTGVIESGAAVSEIPGFLKIAWFGLDEAVAVTLPVSRLGNATLLRTADGGQLWSAIPCDNPTSRFTSASFANPLEGIAAGEMQSYATVVAERAVTIGRPLPTLKQIHGTHLSSNGSAWLVGDAAFVLQSENSGVTWKSMNPQVLERADQLLDFRAVAQKNSVVLIAGAPGSLMLRSTDSGQTWEMNPTTASGEIRRIVFVTDNCVLALGSLGTILRSEDAGQTWKCVRSTDHRAGLLNLVTELNQSPWELIAANSGDLGIRTITAQLSPRLLAGATQASSSLSATQRHQQTRQVMSQLGANDVVAEWSFPRNRPDHHLSMTQLISEWNRQTDGELRRMLPLRLARLIRIWRPTVIVVESAGDDDAVAGLLRDVLPEAILHAASDQSEISRLLNGLLLEPWRVHRLLIRCKSDQATSLAWRHSDLLSSCGTTIGLLTSGARNHLSDVMKVAPAVTDRVCYEVIPTGSDLVTPASLFQGLHLHLNSSSRRPVIERSPEELLQLQEIARAAEIQNSAVLGHLRLANTENSLIAQLGQLGNRLPESLALQQLRTLVLQCQQNDDVDGYLSVLQEIIRRFPESADAVSAAETLFVYYSSAEVRKYRFDRMQRRGERSDRQRRVTPLGITAAASPVGRETSAFGINNGSDAAGSDNVVSSGFSMTPKIERASTVTFGTSAADHAGTLLQGWDRQAGLALNLMQRASADSLSTAVVLRQAANARLAQLTGEHSSLLAEAAGRGDPQSVFAVAESQAAHGAVGGPLRIVNLQKAARRPWLDAVLNDSCWEAAEEIFLTTDPLLSSGRDARTLVMMSWDDDFLYVAALLEDLPNGPTREPQALNRAYDAAHGARDRLELHLDLDRDYSTAFRFCVDQTGQTSESCFLLHDWNPEWYAAVDNDDRSWRLELAIPLRELNLQPTRAGDLWSIRLQRIVPGCMQQTLTANSDAAAAGQRTVADDQGYGMIRFIRNQKR